MIISTSAEQTQELGRRLAENLKSGDVVLLSGDLGAGKTCFTQGIAAGLGIEEQVCSPTFIILQVYQGAAGNSSDVVTLQHFDLYRLEESEQLEDIDYWGCLDSSAVSIVEWGDQFPDALPPAYLLVRIAVLADGSRNFELQAVGQRYQQLASDWMTDS